MQQIIDFVVSLPQWSYFAAGGLGVAILAFVIAAILRRRRFLRRLRTFRAIPGRRDPHDYFGPRELLRKTRLLERLAQRGDGAVIRDLGVDRLWAERLEQKESQADFRRVITYAAQTGLFACFLVSLRNRKLATQLEGYLRENNDFLVIRQLALSGRGEDFSGAAARDFFHERLDEIREMTGDPEWPSRYFAVKILLYDDQDRSRRAVWDASADPHPLIRKTVLTEFAPQDDDRMFSAAYDALVHDPVFEVRKAARERIARSFADRYSLNAAELEREEAIHVVELLDEDSDEDRNAAVALLSGEEQELHFAAARFLDRSGALRRLFTQTDLSDRTEFERNYDILSRAVDVHVTGFLHALNDNVRPASLLLAARLLQRGGEQTLIVDLAERVFRMLPETTAAYPELYQTTVGCIRERGDYAALSSLAREIERIRDDETMLQVALAGVPSGHDGLFAFLLLGALKDPSTPARDELRAAVRRLETSLVLSEIMTILTAGRERYPHQVRIDALKLLGELQLPFALQDILEHLPVLPLDEARAFTALLDSLYSKDLEHKVGVLLDGVDGSVRASLIAALPATGKKTFLTQIKRALGDADPDVRIAATWSLVEYQETRALTQAAEMLRDPLERVRLNVARAIGQAGGDAALDLLQETLQDQNEVEPVKLAAIAGLAASSQTKATDILVDHLDGASELREELKEALSQMTDPRSLKRLIERFKDASPALREAITNVFERMGAHSEEAITGLMAEDIPSLREYLNEILEATGYVESRIRMLNHRDPKVRRGAAEFLARVGTASAFRGLVLAARDPDEEVRVRVTKALERLATPEGEAILHALQQDPEKRIRKYTHWALERIQAKKL